MKSGGSKVGAEAIKGGGVRAGAQRSQRLLNAAQLVVQRCWPRCHGSECSDFTIAEANQRPEGRRLMRSDNRVFGNMYGLFQHTPW
jgi:hypothetical protein